MPASGNGDLDAGQTTRARAVDFGMELSCVNRMPQRDRFELNRSPSDSVEPNDR
jgi:hypothetical protein